MNKTLLGMFFMFGAIVGGYVYLDNTYFLDIQLCIQEGGGWNYEENICTTSEDVTECKKQEGIWIEQENICDFGEIIN